MLGVFSYLQRAISRSQPQPLASTLNNQLHKLMPAINRYWYMYVSDNRGIVIFITSLTFRSATKDK